jgi:hypothetical protein
MRTLKSTLKYLSAIISMLLSGWLFLAYHGLRTTKHDRALGWNIYQLPLHLTLLMVTYLTLATALPFLSAWLMGPLHNGVTGDNVLGHALWRSYLFRLGLSIICASLVALVFGFVTMAFLDSR